MCTDCETSLTTLNSFRNRCKRAIATLLDVRDRSGIAVDGDDEEMIINTQPKHAITDDEQEHTDDNAEDVYVETKIEPIDDDDADEMRSIIEPLDVDEADSTSSDRASMRRDSDDDYEADLVDKYESLDRSYHMEEAPSLPATRRRTSRVLHPAGHLQKTTVTGSEQCDAAGTSDSNNDKSNGQEQGQPKTLSTKRSTPNSGPTKQCYVCGLIVWRMRDHMKSHPGELQYQCEVCPRSYLTKTGRDRHMHGQHPETR